MHKSTTSMENPKTVLIALLIALMIATLCMAGCGPKSRVAQASRDLALTITGANPVDAPLNPAAPTEQRIYLDASLSMKGFVNPQNHSRFDELIDELGDVLPGCKLYKYGQSGSQPPVKISELTTLVGFGRELHEPSFYSLTYNPDDRLIDKLARDEPSVLSVLITDGVYSEPAGGTSPPVANAIQRWLQNGRVLGIFIFKSAFNGPFYSERGRAIAPNISVKERPFYAFVFSPTERALKDLQDKLQARVPEMKTLHFSDDAINCTPILNERAKGVYSFRKPPVAAYHWQMFDPEIFTDTAAAISFGVRCSVAADYPVSELSFTLVPEYHRWQKNKFQKADSLPSGFSAEVPVSKHLPRDKKDRPDGPDSAAESIQSDVVLHLPRDGSCDFGFYHFKLTAAARELRPYLEALSIRDDRDPKDAGKTYRFRELISALAEVHFKTNLAAKTSTAMFVTLTNK